MTGVEDLFIQRQKLSLIILSSSYRIDRLSTTAFYFIFPCKECRFVSGILAPWRCRTTYICQGETKNVKMRDVSYNQCFYILSGTQPCIGRFFVMSSFLSCSYYIKEKQKRTNFKNYYQ